MKQLFSKVKPYLRWLIFGGTLFFVLKAFKDRWQAVADVRIDTEGWLLLVAALGITLTAHTWSALVWSWILKIFEQPSRSLWAICLYLTTNIAKYLPGNVWHLYGRISAVAKIGGSLGAATLSVLLELLILAAAALLVGLTSTGLGWLKTDFELWIWALQIFCSIAILIGIHPRLINPIMHWLSRSQANTAAAQTVRLKNYPLKPLLGEIGFLILRGSGFVFVLMALMPIVPMQIAQIISAFSFAWLLGLIIPGAPGGIGVFEAVAIYLLNVEQFPQEIILTGVAVFRVISILAELIAAGLAFPIKKYYRL